MVHFVVTDSGPSGGIVQPGGRGVLKVESIDFNSKGHEEFILKDSIIKEKIEKLYDLSNSSNTSPGSTTATSTIDPPSSTGKPGKIGKKAAAALAAAAAAGSTPATTTPVVTGPGRRKSATTKELVENANFLVEERGLANERQSGIKGILYDTFLMPESPVGSFGVTEMGMRCLEVSLLFFFSAFFVRN